MRAFSVPQVEVNNDLILIVPNTLNYDLGEGETNVRAASGGGNSIRSVHTQNAESKIGKVMFSVYLTADMDDRIREWKDSTGANAIKFSERLGDGTVSARSFENMSLINSVNREATADGTVPLEFSGDPAI